MKVLAYLTFTLLSILIQFSVMDLIQERLEVEGNKDLNLTSPKKKLTDILKEYSNKPYAFFYRNNNKPSGIKVQSLTINTSESVTHIPITTSVYDILMYDENATTESTVTSELPFTTTTEVEPVENITELAIFGSKNVTTPKPKAVSKKNIRKEKCNCNLVHDVCDINCCCDDDCAEEEIKLFICSKHDDPIEEYFCAAQDRHPVQSSISGLLCIAGSNLPEKRVSNYNEYMHSGVGKIIKQSLKWHDQRKLADEIVFTAKKYAYGDPIWILRNGSISYIDLPTPTINSYCHGRTPVLFLKDEKCKCDVMIQDLEMLNVLKNIEDSAVIGGTDKFHNDSVLNCSSLHCTKWRIIVCDEVTCTNYNKSLHEPTCNDNIVCTDLAHELEYIFNYHDGNIVNATIYLHTRSYSPKIPLITQAISVTFYVAQNVTRENVVKLSGNPGYLKGLPVIVSFDTGNYTKLFFNKSENILMHPQNKNGICVRSNTTYKVVTFGFNARNKCRYNHKELSQNASAVCENILNNVTRLLSLDRKAYLSPLGNPYGFDDKDWLNIEVAASPVPLYGEFRKDASELFCSNVITKVAFVFGYADVSEIPDEKKIKILAAEAVTTSQNMTFETDDISVVLTLETMFIDVTKKPIYEYAGSPNLNIHLPNDFFFPFYSNSNKPITNIFAILLVVLSYVVRYLFSK